MPIQTTPGEPPKRPLTAPDSSHRTRKPKGAPEPFFGSTLRASGWQTRGSGVRSNPEVELGPKRFVEVGTGDRDQLALVLTEPHGHHVLRGQLGGHPAIEN